MLVLKPFLRITILSLILAFLLIYLGVKYHWGDHLHVDSNSSIELSIPQKDPIIANVVTTEGEKISSFEPEIVKTNEVNSLLASMNMEQITEHCNNLLSPSINDALTLELAVVNCVVSNFQETFQNGNIELNEINKQKKTLIQEQCRLKYNQNPQYSLLDKQLLIGICVSDNMSNS